MTLLKFTATWCAPCKRVAPVVAELAERAGVQVVSVDIDQEPELAHRYRVMSVPTFVLIGDRGPVYTGSGTGCLPELQGALEAL